MLNIKVKAPYELKIAHEGDIGFDVYAQEDLTIKNLETKLVSTGVYVELPKGWECQVRPKSGLSSKGVLVHFGTVDNGYRGEIKVNVTNINNEEYTISIGDDSAKMEYGRPLQIKKGQKIAQLVFKRYDKVEIEMVNEIDKDTSRSEDGFGSTGYMSDTV